MFSLRAADFVTVVSGSISQAKGAIVMDFWAYRIRLMMAVTLAGLGFAAPGHAQSTIGDPTPVLGNGVTQSAANAQMNAALAAQVKCAKDKNCAALNAKREAEARAVNALITEYYGCRRRAGDAAGNPAQKAALRKACVDQYNPKFAQSCVGGANTIAICTRYRSRGSIERR
jgi:hypothetical protein